MPGTHLSKYDLSGKTAFVTGGAQSIGFAIAQALAECGARVIIADILEEIGKKAAADLCFRGCRCGICSLGCCR